MNFFENGNLVGKWFVVAVELIIHRVGNYFCNWVPALRFSCGVTVSETANDSELFKAKEKSSREVQIRKESNLES